jgi:hypothetical protein
MNDTEKAELKERLMRTDIEEIEEKLKTGFYDVDARPVAQEVVEYKRKHPDVQSEETPVSDTTRKLAFAITIGLISALYFGLKGASKSTRQSGR